jgi:hypothetical protein
LADPVKEPLTRFHIFVRKGGPYDTGAVFPNGPEVSQIIHEPLGVDFRHDIYSSIFQLGTKLFARRHLGKVAPVGQQWRSFLQHVGMRQKNNHLKPGRDRQDTCK